jgi:predicted kinase
MGKFRKLLQEYRSLDEKLIILNGGQKFGQVLIASGGAGSGKGFALSKFVDGSSYKTFDVDELKSQLIKIAKKKGDKEIANLNLKKPDDVAKLHALVKSKDLVGKQITALLKNANPARLPNLIFDKTGKSAEEIQKVVDLVRGFGYKTEDIHLIWVLTDYKVAYKNNITRPRVVPRDIFLQTHKGASTTMQKIVQGEVPRGLDGEVHVILNNRSETQPWKNKEGENIVNTKGDITPKSFTSMRLKDVKGQFIDDEEVKDRLADWINKNAPKSTT